MPKADDVGHGWSSRPEQIVVTLNPGDLPREMHDRANYMLLAALAEAGYPTETWWNEDRGLYEMERGAVPDRVWDRAARLVADRLALPYREVAYGH